MNDAVFGQPLEIWLARVPVVVCERAEIRNLSARHVGEHPDTSRHQKSSGDYSETHGQLPWIVPAQWDGPTTRIFAPGIQHK